MSDFSGVKINKLGGGLGRQNPSTDNIFGLVCGGVGTALLSLETPTMLLQRKDAEILGINAAYDANNGVLVYHHISEYFRLSPNGKLCIMLVPQTVSQTDMCDITKEYVRKLILSDAANRQIKYVGVVRNPLQNYTATLTNGLDADVLTAVPKAQELINSLQADNIYIDGIMIEGREANGTIASMKDLRTLDSKSVSVVIAQDPTIAKLHANYAKYAAVGTALGSLSIRKVNENLGSVDIANKPEAKKGDENFPLTDQANGLFLQASLSSGVIVNTLTANDRRELKNKGYIFAGSYEGYPYTYFNSSSTCIENSNDFCFIERNRVWNKAARYILETLTPKINSTIKIDKSTGYIKASTVSAWETSAKNKLSQMLADDEVSGIDVYINPKQNVLSGNPIKISVSIVPDGLAEAIEVDLGLKNPFSN